jgi:hypothetical protein
MLATSAISVETMAPEELCYYLRDLIEEHVGVVTGLCAEASLILACTFCQRGLDARVCTGNYFSGPDSYLGRVEEHAYVRLNRQIFDSTREQFENLPLVDDEDAKQYKDEDWGSDALAEHPTFQDISKCLDEAYPGEDVYMKGGFLTVCSLMGIQGM